MNYTLTELKKLKANPANPRVIRDDKFHKLVNSILGFPKMLEIRPPVGDHYVMLGGNQRLRALEYIARMQESEIIARLATIRRVQGMSDTERAKLLEHWAVFCDNPKVPYIEASELTDEEKRQFIITDNALFGEWDWNELPNIYDVEELGEWGVDAWGMEEGDEQSGIEEKKDVQEDDFDESSETIVCRCKKGDIWQCGNHRVMCGDSTQSTEVEKLMGGARLI